MRVIEDARDSLLPCASCSQAHSSQTEGFQLYFCLYQPRASIPSLAMDTDVKAQTNEHKSACTTPRANLCAHP